MVTFSLNIGDHTSAKHYVIMEKNHWEAFKKNNSVKFDMTHGLIRFPYLTMQVKNVENDIAEKLQSVVIDDNLTIPLITTKTITAFVVHPSAGFITGTVTPLD